MLRGYYSPLGEILERRAFAKGIVKREGLPSNLAWAPDGRPFTIGNGKQVRLTEFCTMHHDAVVQVINGLNEMLLGWRPTVDLSKIRDDLNCRTPGWSFLDLQENGFVGSYKALARRAWTSSFRRNPLAGNGHWLRGSCQSYLEAGLKLATKIFVAFHVASSLPGRGSEVTAALLRNTRLVLRIS